VTEALFGVGIDPYWNTIHIFIRKTGHFLGYGVFALLCFRGFWLAFKDIATQLRRKLRSHGMAILATFLVAGADEIHQTFIPNRSGRFSDVVLDTCGGAVLCFGLFLVMLTVDWLRGVRANAVHRSASAYVE
jgi:VanZ family protein